MVTTPRLTYQDYADLEGDDRYELMDGELILAPSPNMDHQEMVTKLGTSFSMFVMERELGQIYFSPTDVVFTDSDVVQPDVLFVSKQRQHIRTLANIEGVPDLIVEILSPSSSRRDWGPKRDMYARHGVREYSIIDPTNRIVSVLNLCDRVLEVDQTLKEDNTAQ